MITWYQIRGCKRGRGKRPNRRFCTCSIAAAAAWRGVLSGCIKTFQQHSSSFAVNCRFQFLSNHSAIRSIDHFLPSFWKCARIWQVMSSKKVRMIFLAEGCSNFFFTGEDRCVHCMLCLLLSVGSLCFPFRTESTSYDGFLQVSLPLPRKKSHCGALFNDNANLQRSVHIYSILAATILRVDRCSVCVRTFSHCKKIVLLQHLSIVVTA